MGIGQVSWHDLRRFFANISGEYDAGYEDREYMMGHALPSMIQGYITDHYLGRLRELAERITRTILGP